MSISCAYENAAKRHSPVLKGISLAEPMLVQPQVMNLLNPGDTPPAARPGQTATQGSAAPVQAVAAGSGQGAASAGARSRKKR